MTEKTKVILTDIPLFYIYTYIYILYSKLKNYTSSVTLTVQILK